MDEASTPRPGPTLGLALSTFGILSLELAVIRWLAGQIRVFAYLGNLTLISAFLGMGLGVALGKRHPHLRHWTLPALALFTTAVALAQPLGLADLTFPDLSIHLWGAERRLALVHAVQSLAVVMGCLASVAGVFLLAGTAVGFYFEKHEALRAYSIDLSGSILGVLALAFLTSAGTPPPAWFGLGALPFLAISPGLRGAAGLVVVLGATAFSMDGAVYSAYNRIEVAPVGDGDLILSVNRDFHQYLHDLSGERIDGEATAERERNFMGIRAVYNIPYAAVPGGERALIVGAGAGNDAQAALRNGFVDIYAVDIDGRILALGEALHPEEPYSNPRVTRVVDDARAFLQRYRGPPFEVVSYGFLDSHAMFSAMSSLRLENYVYTVEGLENAWRLVGDEGVLSVNFSVAAGEWIADRLYWTLAEATGQEPVRIDHGLYGGSTFVLWKGGTSSELVAARLFPTSEPSAPRSDVRTTSDDWPFLYLRPDTAPWAYFLILGTVLLGGTAAARFTFGAGVLGRGFDPPLFFMGAAFLLLETRGITALSLLYGSTWVVNVFVFAGILLVALAANLLVMRLRPEREAIWFVPLFLSLALLYALPASTLSGLPLVTRGIVGSILTGLPVGLAGIVVSIRLSRSAQPTQALGSNLLGAVLGGCLEYGSMWVGLQALLVLAAALYLVAFAFLFSTKEVGPAEAKGLSGRSES